MRRRIQKKTAKVTRSLTLHRDQLKARFARPQETARAESQDLITSLVTEVPTRYVHDSMGIKRLCGIMTIVADDSWPRSLREENLKELRLASHPIEKKAAALDELITSFHLSRLSRETLARVHPHMLVAKLDCAYAVESGTDTMAAYCVGDKRSEFQEILLDACQGLRHIHTKGYALNNLRAENIIVCSNEIGQVVGKIGDFSAAQQEGSEKPRGDVMEMCNSIRHMAPELLNATDDLSMVMMQRASDVWSVGVMTWLFYGNDAIPWRQANENLDMKFWEYCRFVNAEDPTLNPQPPVQFKDFHENLIILLQSTLLPEEDDRWGMRTVVDFLQSQNLEPKVARAVFRSRN